MRAAPHRWAVPKLARWCDEAAVTHWEQDPGQEPVQAFGWDAAAERLIREGRLLKVLHPSESQRQGVISIR